jgi:hypothetical protein
MSKPAWPNTLRIFDHVGVFVRPASGVGRLGLTGLTSCAPTECTSGMGTQGRPSFARRRGRCGAASRLGWWPVIISPPCRAVGGVRRGQVDGRKEEGRLARLTNEQLVCLATFRSVPLRPPGAPLVVLRGRDKTGRCDLRCGQLGGCAWRYTLQTTGSSYPHSAVQTGPRKTSEAGGDGERFVSRHRSSPSGRSPMRVRKEGSGIPRKNGLDRCRTGTGYGAGSPQILRLHRWLGTTACVWVVGLA